MAGNSFSLRRRKLTPEEQIYRDKKRTAQMSRLRLNVPVSQLSAQEVTNQIRWYLVDCCVSLVDKPQMASPVVQFVNKRKAA